MPPYCIFVSTCMASSSLAAGVHGLSTQLIHSNLSEVSSYKRRNVPAARVLDPLQSEPLHQHLKWNTSSRRAMERRMRLKALSENQPSEDDNEEHDSSSESLSQEAQDLFRKELENIVGDDDAKFSGRDLAMLIRNKYGRSYDVQLIKKEFMGRQLLAMNVMWKYREQRSFPLTEEEYLLRLDDVANNLKCWGAVSYVRSSLAKTKERPRIGKAVSIFIDLDESGGRAHEWIYR